MQPCSDIRIHLLIQTTGAHSFIHGRFTSELKKWFTGK
jgi:hypothetical protein